MRIGQNPAKFVDQVIQPERITVATISYIPFIGGYYQQSLDVLKVCLGSIWENSDLPYDLLVFDNGSCSEVRNFLLDAQKAGKIQYLVLSEKNIGKGGAWNFIFRAAPGEIVAYSDSDIYFFPDWLSSLVKVLDVFPQAGMVTGMPMWSPEEFSTNTIRWSEQAQGAILERGQFLPWDDYWRHSRSLGKSEEEARSHYDQRQDIVLSYQGQRFYVGAGHFQFIAHRSALQSVLPVPSDRPMGQVRFLDAALNEKGYLRLSTTQRWVQHLGNTMDGFNHLEARESSKQIQSRSADLSFSEGKQLKSPGRRQGQIKGLFRKFLIWLHKTSFNLLYKD